MGLLSLHVCKNYTNAGFGIIAWSTALSRCDLDERTNRRQLRACFFSLQSRKILREKNAVGGEEGPRTWRGWLAGGAHESNLHHNHGKEGNSTASSRFSFSPSENARTRFALLGQWCTRKRRLVFHLLSHHELTAGFLSRANGILTFENAITPVSKYNNSQIKSLYRENY